MADQSSIKLLEADLWSAADVLRSSANLNANQYCMPVLGLLFLKYAYGRYKRVEAELMKNRPSRGGVKMPVTVQDFRAKSALYIPREAQYDYLLNLPGNIASANIIDEQNRQLTSLGDVVNYAMRLIEQQTDQLKGILPDTYNIINDEVLAKLLRIFNNDKLEQVGGDVIGRIYEYFTGKFSKAIADDDGVFFTPKSLVQMIVNIIEPSHGTVLDPACGSGGMFVQSGDFVNNQGMNANSALTFYGQEKVTFNARLCLMNMAVHGLNAIIKSGDEANTYTQDAHNLVGECDFVMANPPFNVKKVNAPATNAAGRLPFGLPGYNKKSGEIGNANYLWIQYFYAYLNERGRAGFVMASSATDSQNRDKDIREELVKSGAVDVIISVANNFFYTLSLPCTLWFFDKAKAEAIRDKVLFIDARNYYTVVDRNLNEWTEWQIRNLTAIVWLYRGQPEKYLELLESYRMWFNDFCLIYQGQGLEVNADTFEAKRDNVATMLDVVKANLKEHQAALKAEKSRDGKAEIKEIISDTEEKIAAFENAVDVLNQACWLVEKFGETGEYHDIEGLCKIASLEDIDAKNYSLTPGAYVGVAKSEGEDIDFATRMKEIHAELSTLNTEANALMSAIQSNFKGLGL